MNFVGKRSLCQNSLKSPKKESHGPQSSDEAGSAADDKKKSYKERLAMTRATLAESERQELLERAGGPFDSCSESEESDDDSGKLSS